MPLGQGGVVELSDARHAELLHHAPGTPVSDEREGDQFRNAEFRGVCDACPGRLSGVTLAPGVVPQPPEYLDLALQPAGERHAVQSGESQQLSVRKTFDGIRTESFGRKLVADAVEQVGRLFGGERRGEILHDPLVGVHGGESRLVFLPPCAQCEAGRSGRVKHTCLFWVFGECRGSAERNRRSGNLPPPLNPASCAGAAYSATSFFERLRVLIVR